VTDGERALGFLRHVYLSRCERVERRDWGELVVTSSLPIVWDANFAILDRWDGTPAELHAELDAAQAELGFEHRKTVILDEELAARVWPALAEPDWPLHDRFAVMAHRRAPDRPADTASVEELDLDAFGAVHEAILSEGPHAGDLELARQLDALLGRIADVVETRAFGVVADGAPVAGACLYRDGPVAQVEDVATVPAHRNRGHARAVVLRCVEEARAAGAELVFLVANDGDWPKELYAKLGFDLVAFEHMAGRPGQA
jgi:ribosomal protein S18 acetylase RimI-like enzyme